VEDRQLGTMQSLVGLPLDRAMERNGVALAACDAAGRLTFLSPVLQKMFGVEFSELPEEEFPRVFNLLAEDGVTPLPYEQVPLARARAGDYVRDALVTARLPDGSLVRLRCNAAPLEDEAGQSQGAIVLAQDVTLERDLEREQDLVQLRVVETINHEFRTPLAALLGHLELIRDRADELPGDVAQSFDAIERAGWRLRDLVNAATELVEVGVRPHRH
jgi:signal transduction histidine kinase